MSRIRTIKPEFFTSEDIVELTPLARVFYIALWCEADREGRFKWKPKTLKMRYLPSDDCDINELANELIQLGLISIYTISNTEFAEIPSFSRHQVINNREKESDIPENPDKVDACVTRESGEKAEGKGRKGKEGNRKGKEGESNLSFTNDPPTEAMEYYNYVAKDLGLPAVTKMTKARKSKVEKRIEDAGGLDGWKSVVDKLRESRLCQGQNSRGWKASFDFLLQESSFLKLMEGNYDGNKQPEIWDGMRPRNNANAWEEQERLHRSLANK